MLQFIQIENNEIPGDGGVFMARKKRHGQREIMGRRFPVK